MQHSALAGLLPGTLRTNPLLIPHAAPFAKIETPSLLMRCVPGTKPQTWEYHQHLGAIGKYAVLGMTLMALSQWNLDSYPLILPFPWLVKHTVPRLTSTGTALLYLGCRRST